MNLLQPLLTAASAGLSPAWRPQYVLVKDLQTESSYYFLVEEWLSVDNETTRGRVEIEVEATGAYRTAKRLPGVIGGLMSTYLLLFTQRRLCFVACLNSWGLSCRGRCVRVTFGCLCGRGPLAAPSPACREPHAVLCCCSSSCWQTPCGTVL